MKVLKKQTNSKMCLICGVENEAGLKAPFYEMEDNTVISLVTFKEIHQSYPNRVHGGMISCLLDEIIGRAIWISEPNMWGVTMNLNVKFRKPVPYNEQLKAIGKITNIKSRTFEGEGKILDNNGNVLATAEAVYFKLPIDKITEDKNHDEINIYIEDNVKEIV